MIVESLAMQATCHRHDQHTRKLGTSTTGRSVEGTQSLAENSTGRHGSFLGVTYIFRCR